MPKSRDQVKDHRRRLTRYAHELARSGRFENADAVIAAIRDHEDFYASSHESWSFRAALNALCARARAKAVGGDPT